MAGQTRSYTFNDVMTFTMWTYHQTGKMSDNIFKGMPLVDHMHSKNRVVRKRGGDRILVPLMYGKSPNVGTYHGYDVLPTAPQDGFTTIEYNWKQAADSIIISGRELRAIGGPMQLADLLEARQELAELSLMDFLNLQFYTDGTGNDAKDFTGLQAIMASDGQGTYAGVDATQAANAWWRNIVTNAGSFQLNGLDAFRTHWRNQSAGRRSGIADLILTTGEGYGAYEALCEPKQQYQMTSGDNVKAEAGFGPLTYKGIPIIFDLNAPTITVTGVVYQPFWWLNSRYLQLVIHPDADFTPTAFKTPPAQDASVAQILVQGELVCSNRRHQGLVLATTP